MLNIKRKQTHVIVHCAVLDMQHHSVRTVDVLVEASARQQSIAVHFVLGEVGNVLVIKAEQLPVAQVVAQTLRSVLDNFFRRRVLVRLHKLYRTIIKQ